MKKNNINFVYIHCLNVDGGQDQPFPFGKIPKIHSKPSHVHDAIILRIRTLAITMCKFFVPSSSVVCFQLDDIGQLILMFFVALINTNQHITDASHTHSQP